jgi:hypothetical protein
VTSRAEQYRRCARQCLEIASTFQGKEARVILLGQAQAWLRLAHLAQANRQIAEMAVQIARQRVIVTSVASGAQPWPTGRRRHGRLRDSIYRSGRSPDWLKMKNPAAPAAKWEAEEDWGR